jgi:hypothetical protein
MITARDAVLAAAATYDGGAPTFTGLPTGRGDEVERVFLSEVNGELLVAWEGTHDPLGWALDFIAIPAAAHEQVAHPTLPAMPLGFRTGLLSTIAPIADAVKGRTWHAIGHSRGGAIALEAAGWLADLREPPAAVWLFAPACGFTDAPDVLADVPIAGWWCGNDLVPRAPPIWRPTLHRFGKPTPNPIDCHHIGNFLALLAP